MNDVSVFGATFSPYDRRLAMRVVPRVPQQSSFSPRDQALIEARRPQVAVQAAYRAQGVLPRAIHALNNRQDASNQGAAVAERAYQDHVRGGMARLAGLGGLGANAGCTGTGAQVFQGILAGAGGALVGSAQNMSTTQVLTSPTGSTMTVPDTTATDRQRYLAIAGSVAQVGSAIYTGVCEARTGTVSPAVTRAADAGTAAGQLIGSIQTARNSATASSAQPAATAASDPNSATAAEALAQQQEQQAAGGGRDNTYLYVGIGIAALVGLVVVMR